MKKTTVVIEINNTGIAYVGADKPFTAKNLTPPRVNEVASLSAFAWEEHEHTAVLSAQQNDKIEVEFET